MSNEVAIQNGNSMLAPSSMEQAIKLAEMMANANLVPTHLQKKPADCLLVIEQASRWKMSPFAVAQCTSVIQGKLMYEGKLVAAVVNANGNLIERLSFDYSGEGENRTVKVSGRFANEKEARAIEVTLKNVKTANTMWQKQPDQQLMYSGTRAWARRHAPELMLGVYSPEEFDQNSIVYITPTETDANKPKSPFKNASMRNLFADNCIKSFNDCKTTDELTQLSVLNKGKFSEMEASGSEADHLTLEELRKRYQIAWNRLSIATRETPEPEENDTPPFIQQEMQAEKERIAAVGHDAPYNEADGMTPTEVYFNLK